MRRLELFVVVALLAACTGLAGCVEIEACCYFTCDEGQAAPMGYHKWMSSTRAPADAEHWFQQNCRSTASTECAKGGSWTGSYEVVVDCSECNDCAPDWYDEE